MSVEAFLVRPFYRGYMAGGLVLGETTAPDPFTFNAVGGVALSATDVASNTITVQNLSEQASVTLSGDASAEYQKNGGLWVTAPGVADEGDTFAVRLDASASYNTGVSCTLDIGGEQSTFIVTTLRDPSQVDVTAPVNRLFRGRR